MKSLFLIFALVLSFSVSAKDIDVTKLETWEWVSQDGLFLLPVTFNGKSLLAQTGRENCKQGRSYYYKKIERRAEKLCEFVGGHEAVSWETEIAKAGEVLVEAEKYEMDHVPFETYRCKPPRGFSSLKSPLRFKSVICLK